MELRTPGGVVISVREDKVVGYLDRGCTVVEDNASDVEDNASDEAPKPTPRKRTTAAQAKK